MEPQPTESAPPIERMAGALRALAMDAVQRANSGHPGMPMGMADVAYVLHSRFLRFSAADPQWPDRDRFVLSAGHGSMLLYALLHLTGHADFPIDQLRRFRQLGSATAGHPEHGHGLGIETTTGPLGQGLANAVGMALAERMLNARFGDGLVDHRTYAIAGDGCLMEGISHEAASLAGHLRLSRLTVLFDDNSISIDGDTGLAVSDDAPARFAACGWHTVSCDGHDEAQVGRAIGEAIAADRPSLVCCRTVIGKGAPGKQGTAKTHGSPLGEDEVAAARESLGWPHPPFEIPGDVLDAWRAIGRQGERARQEWSGRLAAHPERAEFERLVRGDLPDGWADAIREAKAAFAKERPKIATRKASRLTLDRLAERLPELVGGSADLTESNQTQADGMRPVRAGDFSGRYVHYGVREHAMAAAMNGMALHRGVLPYGGTFLAFSDYSRPAIRLGALMGTGVVHVMSHDSIGLGEDGPTHQPVEHLGSLRLIPGLQVFRPCDPVETAECWELAIGERRRPSLISLTRQGVPMLRTDPADANLCATGGYVILPAPGGERDITLCASGSEVAIAAEAARDLAASGVRAAVVSMPCMELFDQQDPGHRERTIDPERPAVFVEAAQADIWHKYRGRKAGFVSMAGFGASAPGGELYEHFGITPRAVADQARRLLGD